MKRLSRLVLGWVLTAGATGALVTFLFARVDVPVAHHFWKVGRFLSPLGTAFGSVVILSAESAIILGVGFMRLVRGHVSRFAATLATACLTSVATYVLNDAVLKVLCGVPNIADVMHGTRHGFNIWMGSDMSSFPSGHMVLAGAFAGVFMRLYGNSVWPLSALLMLAGGLLVSGDWHFSSDVVAGTFFGLSAGLLAGELRALRASRTGLNTPTR